MSNPDDAITTALRDLADEAAPPRIRVDDAWRAGRRRRRAAVGTSGTAIATALSAVLLAGLPGPGSSYSPAAQHLLERAARVAAAQPSQPVPHPGQYILATSAGTTMTDEPGIRAWMTVERSRTWWPVDPSKPGISWSDRLRNERLPWGGPAPSSELGTSWMPTCPADAGRFTYKFMTTLPTNPANLRAWIYAHKAGGQSDDDQAWTDISDLLSTGLTPPALTAALFRVLATIPGATVVPHARDAAGRAGIAVARKTHASGEDDELIFSDHTYRLLGGRATLTVPQKEIGPAGTVIGGWALLKKTVVNHLPPSPHGHDGADLQKFCVKSQVRGGHGSHEIPATRIPKSWQW